MGQRVLTIRNQRIIETLKVLTKVIGGEIIELDTDQTGGSLVAIKLSIDALHGVLAMTAAEFSHIEVIFELLESFLACFLIRAQVYALAPAWNVEFLL